MRGVDSLGEVGDDKIDIELIDLVVGNLRATRIDIARHIAAQ